MTDWGNKTHVGDCRVLMRQMIADGVRVQCIVTSPPYWALRDYGVAGQFGLERSWIRHIARMRYVFRLTRQLLAEDGTLWLNYGDVYAGAPGGFQGKNGQRASRTFTARIDTPKRGNGLKPKDLVGMPWRLALTLQDDGWWLRSEIIWHKPNPMPESIRDRPTKAHEHLFLLTRSERYYYDFEACKEQVTGNANPRRAQEPVAGWATGDEPHDAIAFAKAGPKDEGRKTQGLRDSTKFGRGAGFRKIAAAGSGVKNNESFDESLADVATTRNMRSVWTIPTEAFGAAHFATFPRALVRRCILAGSRPGDIVFDPFMGSGTVAQVATDLGRHFIGCELNPEYVKMHEMRRTTIGMSY